MALALAGMDIVRKGWEKISTREAWVMSGSYALPLHTSDSSLLLCCKDF